MNYGILKNPNHEGAKGTQRKKKRAIFNDFFLILIRLLRLGGEILSSVELTLNRAIQAIIENPVIGEQKCGDLSWLRVYKFKMLGALTLIGYSVNKSDGGEEDIVSLVAFGPHENFYRDLKRQSEKKSNPPSKGRSQKGEPRKPRGGGGGNRGAQRKPEKGG